MSSSHLVVLLGLFAILPAAVDDPTWDPVSGPPRRDLGLTATFPQIGTASVRPLRPRAAQVREIVWIPDPAEPEPFGYIPTEWNVRPQLLPLTWEAQTVFARNDARR